MLGDSVPFVLDLEMVEVAVAPSHHCLDVAVQGVELAVGDLDPPPDLGFRAKERDLELVDGAAGFLGGGFFAGVFLGMGSLRRWSEARGHPLVHKGGGAYSTRIPCCGD